MARYIDADAVKNRMILYGFHSADQTVTEFVEDVLPVSDVVSKEKYDELNERYHRLLESAKILSDAVSDYERREDK